MKMKVPVKQDMKEEKTFNFLLAQVFFLWALSYSV